MSMKTQLERERILNDLKDCKILEDYEEVTKKYEALCNADRK